MHGQCGSVGVGGYLAKGGINWLNGLGAMFGTGASNVVRHTVVTAAGDIYNVDEEGMHWVDMDTGMEVSSVKVCSPVIYFFRQLGVSFVMLS